MQGLGAGAAELEALEKEALAVSARNTLRSPERVTALNAFVLN